jgi:hypothetical protein
MKYPRGGILTILAIVATSLAASACAGSSTEPSGATRACPPIAATGTSAVPNVVAQPFTRALAKLLNSHLRVAVPRFVPFHDAMAEQGWGRLANYHVVAQSPAAGETRPAGSTVTLKLSNPLFRGPLGSMVEPLHHPRYAHIPDLVDKTYRQAMATESEKSGILIRVSSTAPLRSAASTCGLNAFTVSRQTPRPGTRVLWGGVNRTGVDPGLATVTITLATLSSRSGP